MSRYNEDLDYLILDADISKEEIDEIIADSNRIISDTNPEKDKLVEAYLKKVQCLQKLDRYDESNKFIDKLLALSSNMPEALIRQGNVYLINKEYDKAIDYIAKAIDFNNGYAYAYCIRGCFYDNKKDYDKAIKDYDKAIEINSNYAIAYFNRGIAKSNLLDYQGAIDDYSKAIKINPNDADTYVNRGIAKGDLLDYNGAIEDCTIAIEINHNEAKAYLNRGFVRHNLSDYDGAIEDYSEAIRINPKYSKAYFNRGIAKYDSSDYSGAIEDYSKAIEINPNDVDVYHNRGVAFGNMKNYKNAAEDFIKAETDMLNVLIILEKNCYGENVVNFMLDYDEFFKSEIVEKKQKQKTEDYKNIFIQSLKIISKLHIKEEIEMPVSHYTRKNTSEELLFDKDYSFFRLSSVNTSNDPEEGKTLFHYLFPQENISSKIEEFGAFAGCFTFNNDSLNQFRLYGKTEDNEDGTGVSIALNSKFFNKEISIIVETKSELKDKNDENYTKSLPLFRCIYIDPETNKVVSLGQKEEYVFYRENKDKKDNKVKSIYQDYKKNIDEIREEIDKSLKELKKQIEEKCLDCNIVHKILLNLRYLIKHVAFKEEQECRIIQIRKLDDRKIESNKNGRLYVEYLKLNKNNVSEICFAPKAKDIDKFKQHLARNNYSVKCYKSTAPWA